MFAAMQAMRILAVEAADIIVRFATLPFCQIAARRRLRGSKVNWLMIGGSSKLRLSLRKLKGL